MTKTLPLLLALLATGCGAAMYAGEPSSSSASSSGYSGSSSSTSEPSGPGLAPNRQAAGSLVVRPDVLTVAFRLRAQEAELGRSLAALQARVDELGKRLKGATGGSAVVKTTGFSVAHGGGGKSKSDERDALVDGVVEIPLPATLDYWGRARLVVALSDVTQPSLYKSKAEGDEPSIDASFDAPHAAVKDPEAFRPELIKLWVKRARALAAAAQTDAAPLSLVDCAPPAEITQQPVSLEEVALTVRVACRLDTVGGTAQPGRGATAQSP